MKTEVISFRLRKELDADLAEAVRDVNKEELKTLCRNGLRLMLGIRTTRTVEVQERPLSVPQSTKEVREPEVIKTAVTGSKPAVYIPKRS